MYIEEHCGIGFNEVFFSSAAIIISRFLKLGQSSSASSKAEGWVRQIYSTTYCMYYTTCHRKSNQTALYLSILIWNAQIEVQCAIQ